MPGSEKFAGFSMGVLSGNMLEIEGEKDVIPVDQPVRMALLVQKRGVPLKVTC
jgi:hypothetical protein